MFRNHINIENRIAIKLNPINNCALCTQPSIPFEAIREVEGRKWKLNRTEKAQRISFPSVS